VAIKKIPVEEFLALSKQYPVLDVRSPGEFTHAHIPGAYSLPLFSDEERKVVGTAYKQESREKAIKIGLEYFGKKMVAMVEEVEAIVNRRQPIGDLADKPGDYRLKPAASILVHCWRGGMRSAGVAWLLDLYGFKVYTLSGGYKSFRNWALAQFEREYDIRIIGGYTGSGKTEVLKELQSKGEAVVDIEGIANHKGSAFGNIGLPKQPSQEMFENLFALALATVSGQASTVIWMEDESQRIGDVNIPSNFFRYMRSKPVLFLDIPFEARLDHIVEEYGQLDREKMADAINRIQKRLGGLEAKNATDLLAEGNLKESFRILLRYYDKWYGKSLQLREEWQALVTTISCASCDPAANAATLRKIISSQPEKING
jgi:tRNA 2-selenouridine synthase